MSWNFELLPEHEHKKAIEAFQKEEIHILVKLHNKYNLSSFNYCCNPDEAMLNWYSHAIENKLIQ